MNAREARWYVVNTKPASEFESARQLDRQEFKTLLPWTWKTVRHGRRFRLVKAPLFPSYLFVEIAVGQQRWQAIRSTKGVRRLIMEGERPLPVPPHLMQHLFADTDADGLFETKEPWRPGQKMQVVLGPFAGSVGEFIELAAAQRVTLLMDALGGRVRATVNREAVILSA